jgi:hypothetical protein
VNNHNVEDLPEAAHELMRQVYLHSTLNSFKKGREKADTVQFYRYGERWES